MPSCTATCYTVNYWNVYQANGNCSPCPPYSNPLQVRANNQFQARYFCWGQGCAVERSHARRLVRPSRWTFIRTTVRETEIIMGPLHPTKIMLATEHTTCPVALRSMLRQWRYLTQFPFRANCSSNKRWNSVQERHAMRACAIHNMRKVDVSCLLIAVELAAILDQAYCYANMAGADSALKRGFAGLMNGTHCRPIVNPTLVDTWVSM